MELKALGWSYSKIAETLNIVKSTVGYHCGKNQKEKARHRQKQYRKSNSPIKRKIEAFLKKRKNKQTKVKSKLKKKLKSLISKRMKNFIAFRKTFNGDSVKNIEITVESVYKKIGNNPVCYLTGKPIDLEDTNSYSFDHIIPVSRGGQSTIENLGLTTSQVNKSKNNMTPEEFYIMCKQVVNYFENKKVEGQT